MARKPVAAAPSPEDKGKADEEAAKLAAQQEAADKEAQEKADAEKAEAEAKAKQEAADKEAQEKADAEAMAKKEAEDREAAEKAEAEKKAAADKEAQEKADAEALAEAAESAPSADESGEWVAPEVSEFPATLSITNAQPGRAGIKGTDHTLEPGETRNITFTKQQFGKFLSNVSQIAQLKGWKAGEGISIQEVGDDG